jgi:hypothetical protein
MSTDFMEIAASVAFLAGVIIMIFVTSRDK